MTKPLDTPTLQARDLILEVCRHRLGLTLTETVARDLANNAATALIPLLEDLSRGHVVRGSVEGPGAIPTSEEPPVRLAKGERGVPCQKTPWCGDYEGHLGECCPPF